MPVSVLVFYLSHPDLSHPDVLPSIQANVTLAMAGVVDCTKDEMMQQYYIERFCIKIDTVRAAHELSPLVFPFLPEFRKQV